jgi:hypothetical protein
MEVVPDVAMDNDRIRSAHSPRAFTTKAEGDASRLWNFRAARESGAVAVAALPPGFEHHHRDGVRQV